MNPDYWAVAWIALICVALIAAAANERRHEREKEALLAEVKEVREDMRLLRVAHVEDVKRWYCEGIKEGRASFITPALDLHTRQPQERILRLGGDRA